MALRRLYAPFRPDLNKFLFAAVGEERNGIPLSMMSALAQLDLDPWEEAGRLSTLAKQEAIERLTGLILRLPGMRRPSSEAQQIAAELVDALPMHKGEASPAQEVRRAAQPRVREGVLAHLPCRRRDRIFLDAVATRPSIQRSAATAGDRDAGKF